MTGEDRPDVILQGVGVGYNLRSGPGIRTRYNFGLSCIPENSNTEARFNTLRFGLSWTIGNTPAGKE